MILLMGIEPIFCVDSNNEKWGDKLKEISIFSPMEICKFSDLYIFITCSQSEIIKKQLHQMNVPNERIFEVKSINQLINVLSETRLLGAMYHKQNIEKNYAKIFFALDNGLVLGGVEAWAIQMASQLNKNNKNAHLLTYNDSIRILKNVDVMDEKLLANRGDASVVFKELLALVEKNLPCNFVNNFIGEIFQISCIAKLLWKDKFRLIAIVHSDDERYYNSYLEMKELIDYCVVTNENMYQIFLKNGMSENKIIRMSWDILCNKNLKRYYSNKFQPIRLGYAGRLEIIAKRMDLLEQIIYKLNDKNIEYILEIAGEGSYEHEMKKNMDIHNCNVKFLGMIERKYISEFWSRQDICLNCSDYEGRCISKAEAMASGAVPVITNTSSAKEDVIDGYNGYVVSVGDIDAMVDKIVYLYQNREYISKMGENAHQTILKQNEMDNVDNMWNKLLI